MDLILARRWPERWAISLSWSTRAVRAKSWMESPKDWSSRSFDTRRGQFNTGHRYTVGMPIITRGPAEAGAEIGDRCGLWREEVISKRRRVLAHGEELEDPAAAVG